MTLEQIKAKVSEVAASYGADRMYLFGSYARGDNHPQSDIDLRVDAGELRGYFAIGGLLVDLEAALGVKVDLLTTGGLDQKFLDRIKEEEILLYEK